MTEEGEMVVATTVQTNAQDPEKLARDLRFCAAVGGQISLILDTRCALRLARRIEAGVALAAEVKATWDLVEKQSAAIDRLAGMAAVLALLAAIEAFALVWLVLR